MNKLSYMYVNAVESYMGGRSTHTCALNSVLTRWIFDLVEWRLEPTLIWKLCDYPCESLMGSLLWTIQCLILAYLKIPREHWWY